MKRSEDKILAYIQTNRSAKPVDLARHLGLSRVRIHTLLKKLVAQEVLSKDGQAPLVHYSLAKPTPDKDASINSVVNRIITGYHPEKIILFGSRAQGHTTPDSDIDLLIIKDTPDDYWTRVKKVIALHNSFTPLDFWVVTPTELDQAVRERRIFLTQEILGKGKVLYDKHAAI